MIIQVDYYDSNWESTSTTAPPNKYPKSTPRWVPVTLKKQFYPLITAHITLIRTLNSHAAVAAAPNWDKSLWRASVSLIQTLINSTALH